MKDKSNSAFSFSVHYFMSWSGLPQTILSLACYGWTDGKAILGFGIQLAISHKQPSISALTQSSWLKNACSNHKSSSSPHTIMCTRIYPLLVPNYFWVEQIHFLVPWITQLCDLTTMMTFSRFLESSYSITIKAYAHLLKKFLFKTWCQVSTGEEKIRATLWMSSTP